MRLRENNKTWVEVSRSALENNIKVVRRLLWDKTTLLAVVKSNAYGHGLAQTAKLFCNGPSAKLRMTPSQSTDWLGVDNIDEAIELRHEGIKSPILVMGFTPKDRFKEASRNDLRLTLYNDLNLDDAYAKIPFHLKIDTGMSRQGILVSDLPQFLNKLPPRIKIEGVFTHFANADNLDDRTYPDYQLQKFQKALAKIDNFGIKLEIRHASATTGFLTMPQAQFDMVRLGVALYGLWPSTEFAKKFSVLGLEPALTWKTRIAQIKEINKNTPVGYGITERVKKNTKIAVLPVGYFDGYPRALSSTGEVLIGGQRCKILGRISMNLMVADISKIVDAKVWAEVVLIGRQDSQRVTAEELADKAGTISYEIVARINPLLPRFYN